MIIGYEYHHNNESYAPAVHCPRCTRKAAANGTLTLNKWFVRETDEHGVPQIMTDRRGDAVLTVERDESTDGLCCGQCNEELA